MREILPYRLYLGNALDARDLRRLYELEIAAVIDLAMEEPPGQLGRDIAYCRFPLLDGSGNSFALIRIAIDTPAAFMQAGKPTLVACGAGMSRSPAIAAAALSILERRQLDECLVSLAESGPHDVSPLFWEDVRRSIANPLMPSLG
jgi:hypothetical protein